MVFSSKSLLVEAHLGSIFEKLSKKRKAAAQDDEMFGRSSSKKKAAPVVEESKATQIAQFFDKYADPEDPENIAVDESFGNLCDDLGIDGGSDVRAIVLLWRLGATRKNPDKPMLISKDTFRDRMSILGASSLPTLKATLNGLDLGFLENDAFYEFYSFAFDLNRDVPRKTLLRETVLDLLPIVMPPERAPHLKYFIAFLEQQSALKDITLDQWKTFLTFNQQVAVDCSGYSADDGAWPLLFDDYVEWRVANK